MKIDWHIHTIFSEDSTAEPADMIKAAVAAGFEGIGIAEHYDLNPNDNGYGYFKNHSWLKSMDDVKTKYSDRIKVYAGIEFGEPHLYQNEYKKITQSADFVIGSIHWCDDLFMAQRELIAKYGVEGMYVAYFKQMLAMTDFGGFDILGHFDFPIRYHKKPYDIDNPLIKEILRNIIEKDIALEINSSNLRYGMQDTMPSYSILSIYNDMGGRLISFGSDAHCPSHVGSGYDTFELIMTEYPLFDLFSL